MELVTRKKLYLVSGRVSRYLAEEIAEALGETLGDPNLAEFANGEIHCRFNESVRGTDVFIIQTHAAADGQSINDAVMEQLIMVDAARRASAPGYIDALRQQPIAELLMRKSPGANRGLFVSSDLT